LSPPDTDNGARIGILPKLPRDDDGPAFAEPWQAQAFALAVQLSEQGYFTWAEWVEVFSGELQATSERGEPDDGSHYYEHWLVALEKIVTRKGLSHSRELSERKAEWIEAFKHTPHGQPVALTPSSSANPPIPG